MTYFNMITMDTEGNYHVIRSYQKTKFQQMKPGLTFKLTNLVKKADSFWMTSMSSVSYTQPIGRQPEGNAPKLPEDQPPTGIKRSLKESLETEVLSTVKVKIVEVSPVKLRRDNTLPVKILGVKDKSAISKICLFADNAMTNYKKDDVIEVTSTYAKQHDNKKSLSTTHDTTIQFLPDDGNIKISDQDVHLFADDGDFHESQQEVTVPEFTKVAVYPCCGKLGCLHKKFINNKCPVCNNSESELACRVEVKYQVGEKPLQKAVLFKEDLEKILGSFEMDEDAIIETIVQKLPIRFKAYVTVDHKFKDISKC